MPGSGTLTDAKEGQSLSPAQGKGKARGPGPAQKWPGFGPAQSKRQTYGGHVPGAKVAGLRHGLVGTDEPLSVAAPRSKGQPATESNPGAKVARTRPSAK